MKGHIMTNAMENHQAEIKAESKAQDSLRRFFERLPKELRAKLLELTKAYFQSTDDKHKEEILKTYSEIMFPTTIGEVEGFETLSDENARKKLNRYRVAVGNAVRAERERKKMSQVELADKAGLPQSHISRVENGVHTTTNATIRKIASALNVNPLELDPGFEF